MQIVFATNNEHKIREIQAVLPASIHILQLADIGCTQDLPETHDTIEENSQEKARFVHNYFQVNCFAEDTGLEVEFLNGEPGVHSARYAGEERNNQKNIALLLHNLRDQTNRKAHFKTVITLIINSIEKQFTGILEGTIGYEPRGEGGFGYDPVFVLADGRTLAELSLEEKGKVSHRGKATEGLVEYLRQFS